MSFSCLSTLRVHLNNQATTIFHSTAWGKGGRASAGLAVLLPFMVILLASCTNPFGGNNVGAGKTPATTATAPTLADLHWCGMPSMLFRDEGALPAATASASATPTSASGGTPTATAKAVTPTPTRGPGTPTTIASWDDVKTGLTFTVFLPASLPAGTCLVSAQATIHDPTLGGNFLIGYLLPDHSALTISEAPLISQNTTFQCNVSGGSSQKSPAGSGTPGSTHATPTPTPLPLQLCSGAKETTNIVLSAQRSVEYLQKLFAELQPDVNWIPRS